MEAAILIVHLLAAITAGLALAVGTLLSEFSVWTAMVAYVVGANCGLLLSVVACLLQSAMRRSSAKTTQLHV